MEFQLMPTIQLTGDAELTIRPSMVLDGPAAFFDMTTTTTVTPEAAITVASDGLSLAPAETLKVTATAETDDAETEAAPSEEEETAEEDTVEDDVAETTAVPAPVVTLSDPIDPPITLFGTAMADELIGGTGDDRLFGFGGADVLIGSAGDDVLSGGEGNDSLFGDDGDDLILGGEGDDLLAGGLGENRLFGEDGIDTVDYSALVADIFVDLDVNSASGAGTPSQIGTARLAEGDALDDTIIDAENIIGGAGNDTLFGNNENNFIQGGDGDDVIHGFGGPDIYSGGAGNDTALFTAAGNGVIADLVAGFAGPNVLIDIENLAGSAVGDDTLLGDAGDNVLTGNGGDDVLDGRGGSDTLDGGMGTDTADFSSAETGVTVNLILGTALTPAVAGELDFLGEQTLPTGFMFGGTEVGGLSGIDYDPNSGTFFAIADDQSFIDLARFYNLSLEFDGPFFTGVTFNSATTLLDTDNAAFEPGTVDPESIRLNPFTGTLFWTSEGNAGQLIDPFVREMTVAGQFIREFELPEGFSPTADGSTGIRTNLAFESFTVTADGATAFAATENALFQDGPAASLNEGSPTRFVRYDVETGAATGEFIYFTDPIAQEPVPAGSFATNGLVEILAISETQFITVERSFSVGQGNAIKLFLADLAPATDVTGVAVPDAGVFQPVVKTELADLADFGITPDNIEGITFGPALGEDRQTLILVSDNNFNPTQITQFLAFDVATALSADTDVDTLVSIENVTGSDFNDTLTGDEGDNLLSGGDGDDFFFATGGEDTIDGGDGSDTLSFADFETTVTVDLGLGVTVFGDGTGGFVSGIENLVGSAGNDTFFEGSGDGPVTFYGGAGDDLLVVSSDDTDTLTGGAGSDTFQFNTLEGEKFVTDFEGGADTLAFFDLLGETTAEDVLATAVTDGPDTILNFESLSVILVATDISEISADDITFI